jgi:hypothetical protein
VAATGTHSAGVDAGHLVLRQLDRAVEQRLVRDDAVDLDAARAGQDQLGLRVVDALGELVGGEAAEHHGVDRADARAREHRDHGLGHHRHVDDHPVALLDALAPEHAGAERHRVAELAIGIRLDRAGHGAVVDEGFLLAAAPVHMNVHRVVAGVERTADEPPIERLSRVVEDAVPALVPEDLLGGRGPERDRVLHRALVGLVVDALRHECPPAPLPSERRGERYHAPSRRRNGRGSCRSGSFSTTPIDNR